MIFHCSLGYSWPTDTGTAGRQMVAMVLRMTLMTPWVPSFVDEVSPWSIDVEATYCSCLAVVQASSERHGTASQLWSYPPEYTAEKRGDGHARWRALVSRNEMSAMYHIPSPALARRLPISRKMLMKSPAIAPLSPLPRVMTSRLHNHLADKPDLDMGIRR